MFAHVFMRHDKSKCVYKKLSLADITNKKKHTVNVIFFMIPRGIRYDYVVLRLLKYVTCIVFEN